MFMMACRRYIYLYLALGVGLLHAQGFTPQYVTHLAINPSGPAFEFVARADQNGDSVSSYGYLSYINGIDDALLFANGTSQSQHETNARFTFVSKSTFTHRFVNANVIVGVQDETISIYFAESPIARDFNEPDTFAQGNVVAKFHDRVQSILNVQVPISQQGPGRAVIYATTHAIQQRSTVFTLDGKRYVIGRIGSQFQLEGTGEGILTSSSPLTAHFVLGGFAEEANRRLVTSRHGQF